MLETDSNKYKTIPWPKIRDLIDLVLKFHRPTTIYGLSEFDVTAALDKIAQFKQEHGINVTLYTYIVYAFSQLADRYPKLITYRHGRDKMVVFESVNIGMTVLKKLPNGITIPGSFVLRNANRKSLAQINAEIKKEVESPLAVTKSAKFRRNIILKLPRFIQYQLYKRIMMNPIKLNNFFGNVGVTSIRYKDSTHLFAGFPPNIFTVQACVGNVSDKFLPDEHGRPSLRKVLAFTGGVDHLIADGMDFAEMSKFMSDFVSKAVGLDEQFIKESCE